MKYVIIACRILVGALFIVSGLIKSNDAYGFKYKLEEYFEPGALNMEFLAPYAMGLVIIICVGEVLLGIAILTGAKPKLSSALTLAIMLFFTWLTFYTSTCDPHGTKTIIDAAGMEQVIANQCVLECGCFGNAIPLTPWESFIKDLVLLVLVIPIVFWAFKGKIAINTAKEDIVIYTAAMVLVTLFSFTVLDWLFPVLFTALTLFAASLIKRYVKGKNMEWVMAGAVLLICSVFQYRTLAHLPMKDYRPYAVGNDIREQMKSAEELGLSPPVYATEYLFTNIHSKKDSVILSTEWLRIYNEDWFKRNYEINSYDGEEVLIQAGYEPAIKDFGPMSYDGEEMTSAIVDYPGYVFLHVSNSLSETNTTAQPLLNQLAVKALENGHQFFGLTNALYDQAETYRHEHQSPYDFLNCDQIELKIIVRSNPGLVLIKDGVVLQKWAWRDIPDWETVSSEFIR